MRITNAVIWITNSVASHGYGTVWHAAFQHALRMAMDDHTSLHLAGLGGSHWDRHYCPRQHAMQPTTRLGRAGFPACKLIPLGRISHTGSCPTHTQAHMHAGHGPWVCHTG